ncbi:hypothetical protein ACOW3R_004352 [Vibrio vulnificus]
MLELASAMWKAQKEEWYRLLVGFTKAGGFTEEELETVEPFVRELFTAHTEGREPEHNDELKQSILNLLTDIPNQPDRLTEQGIDMFGFLEYSMGDYLRAEI